MKWIGLTGGIASGKSTVAKFFEEFNIPVIGADQVSHNLTRKNQEAFKEIVRSFGNHILSENGELDRKQLAKLVFSQPDQLQLLESILHPKIQKYVKEQKENFQKEGHLVAVYDVPLLFEKKMQNQFDRIILVQCTLENQRQRMKERNHWTDLEIDQRLKNQIPLKDKASLADIVIENDGSLADLKSKIKELIDNGFTIQKKILD